MPNEAPLLTIAIPTYNRASYLDQLLAILLEQTSGELRWSCLCRTMLHPMERKL